MKANSPPAAATPALSPTAARRICCAHCAGIQLRPRPPDEVAALVRELHAIGNNANQIAYWANAQKSAAEPELRRAAALVYKAARLVKEQF